MASMNGVTTFGSAPTGSSAPDSITMENGSFFVEYGNAADSTGAGGSPPARPRPTAGSAAQPRLRRRMRLYRLYEGRGTSTWNSYAVVGEETPGVPAPGVSGRYDRQAGLRALPKDQVGDRARPLAACGARGKRLGRMLAR
jgi:hypothetical protein